MCVFVFWLLSTGVGLAQPVLPQDLRAMPVLIQVPLPGQSSSSFVGTGIYLMESNKTFLVTAKHVIFDITSTSSPLPLKNTNATFTAWTTNANEGHKHILAVDLRLLNDSGFVRQHPKRDIAVIEVGTNQLVTTNKGTILYHSGIGMSIGPDSADTMRCEDALFCASSNVVYEGCDVIMLGYPVELMEKFTEVDFSRALVRRGIISQVNATTGKFIIDSGVYGGNSGGPLFLVSHPSLNITQYKVAGIMVQFVPAQTRVFQQMGFTNSVLVFSGYSVAEPIDGALELMRR